MTTRLNSEQRAGVARDVRRGVPLWFIANGWAISEATALRYAGLTKSEHARRAALRLRAAKQGLDSDDADRYVLDRVPVPVPAVSGEDGDPTRAACEAPGS